MGAVASTSDITSTEQAPYTGLPPVATVDYETSPEKRDRTLKHLLRANHHNYSVLYSQLRYHNHLPHALGTAYLLGASAETLNGMYEEEIRHLEPWVDAPGEISRHDWRDFLSMREYQRAFLDFFEDELVRFGYDWKAVVTEYMLKGPEPMLFGGIGGLGHPLIHLGYAFELNSKDVAMEALTLAATNYNFLHNYIDRDFPTTGFVPTHTTAAQSLSSKAHTTDPLAILDAIRTDARFDNLFDSPGSVNIEKLFAERESAVLEHYYSLDTTDLAQIHRAITHAAVLLLCATHTPGETNFDFFYVHLLTVSHAVRTLLPVVPVKYALPLVRSHWLFVIIVYIIQLRPMIHPELVEDVDVKGRGWEQVVGHVLEKESSKDVHYLKAVRAMRDAAGLWEEDGEFYLKAAVKLAWEFVKWGGFDGETN
ncbi:uncharacterized protein H6S33_002147 [Morchella sextelata]|uniref:uncharacterized protein n=1 Tax=Morchella sextelata TaxID=1174677 RepID=UPI001D058F31|nr:uncharacterized protein H6S33_002147 [Morchella sextelata]KAH0608095.1 hypothetical protein H6S33_002147 [Morchella sextelata]